MKEMAQTKAFLKSKISRRIVMLFVLCALLPLFAISVVSYGFVSHQLKTEAYYRLRRQCKTKGFEIYERLLFLENELTAVANEIGKGQWRHRNPEPYNPVTREGARFRSVIRIDHKGRVVPILGSRTAYPPELFSMGMHRMAEDKSVVVIENTQDSRPNLFMVCLIDPESENKGYVAGEIEPLYLWGIGAEGSLPAGVEMVVCQPGRQVLVSSFRSYEFSHPLFQKVQNNPSSGTFESRHETLQYINAYWSLFLNHRFGVSDWVIILSQSKPSVLAPVSNFLTTFVLLILLTFWIIMLAALVSIRKRMLPVEALTNGARKIAGGNFDHRVRVQSGDEFEIVADAFNDMGEKLQKSQAMLVQAAKMSTFGQMAAGIVHEIGQPLSSIAGYSDLLAMDNKDKEAERFLSIMRTEISRLTEIIAKFRTFSRNAPDCYTTVQLNDVVEQTRKLLSHQLEMSHIHLHVDLHKDLPCIKGDKNGLQQIFLNLIINAADALDGKPRGEGIIEARTYLGTDNQVCVEIKDNGCGIAPENHQSIFEPFFTTKTEEKGTGLGLAIIQSIVHKHHGLIEMQSEPGRGTCFTLIFQKMPTRTHDMDDVMIG